jgi:HEAT repeat protein
MFFLFIFIVSGNASANNEQSTKAGSDEISKSLSLETDAKKMEELIKNTEAPEWKARWDAVNDLGKLKDFRGIPALIKRALYDENPHPRWRSLWALSSIDRSGTEAIPVFLEAIKEKDSTVAHNAAVALSFFGRSEARPRLFQALKEANEFRRWEAVFSFRKIGNADVVQILNHIMSEKNEASERVRGEAVLVLGGIGNEEMISKLLNILHQDSSFKVRYRAALSLSMLGNACLAGQLKEALSSEKNSLVLESIEKAIDRVKRVRLSSTCP